MNGARRGPGQGLAESEPEIREEIQQYVAALRGVPETGAVVKE